MTHLAAVVFSELCTTACQNGGTCVGQNLCECREGFFGTSCSLTSKICVACYILKRLPTDKTRDDDEEEEAQEDQEEEEDDDIKCINLELHRHKGVLNKVT